ncbi:tyrosine-type recombinase/integrase [Amycolatopsis sp. NPDC051758]|uniref:tyrosine-type recombinase/integrase n=1 Tax=Amycolatopsis sp. NPDC051758 TaxID=3363935 RepID=UPI00379DD761
MASIDDRWMQQKKDPRSGKKLFDDENKPILERTDRYGKGLRYRVRWYDVKGEEQSLSFPDKTLTTARDFATKVEHDLRVGTFIDPRAGEILVENWGKSYLQGRSQDESSQLTLGNMIKSLVVKFLGTWQLNEVDDARIREWKHWLANESGASANYQADAWEVASLMFDAAVDARKIYSNPFKRRSITGPKRTNRLVTPWLESKMYAIEGGLRERDKISVPIAGGLGLRLGETLAFSPDFIDRRRMMYRCARQLVYRNGVLKFKLPKNHREREIPISAGVLQRIDEYSELFPSVKVTLPWAEQDGIRTMTVNLLITDDRNNAWRPSVWSSEIWKKGFKAANVEYGGREDGLHALRHLYASYMLTQGVSIKELAIFLGHKSEGFTLRTYVHLMPSGYERARLATDTIFPPTLHPDAHRDGNQRQPHRVSIASRRAAGIRRPGR